MGRVEPGSDVPLGVSLVDGGVNVAVASHHAEAIDVCFFDATGGNEVERVRLPERSGDVWHGHIPGIVAGALYGLRADGPYAPELGHRFNHHKLLVDPYARLLQGELRWDNALCGYQVGHPDGDLSFDDRDSAPYVPKCVVTANSARAPGHLATPLADSIIYEGHVRGLTMRHPDVPPDIRGTFAGLASPALIQHLHRLGVTAVELLPVHAFISERFLVERDRSNYWGYNTLAFLAPHGPYLGGEGPEGFAQMVTALHDAGLEVILDVVYNHTGEGNELGPTLSLRGLDNASYYRLNPDNPRYYANMAGTGNTIDAAQPLARDLIVDSLRYWATQMGVDGFRFDLATVLGRDTSGFTPEAELFAAIAADPVLQTRKLIAEPWDVGDGGYRLGEFPPGWSEWNDRFRDTTRRFWRGDAGTLADFASRLSGSGDRFDRTGRAPSASLNYITAHDGMTLCDLVSYSQSHNDANGEGGADGHPENHSANSGVEGPTDDPQVRAVRAKQQRNLLASLLLAHGVPMLLAGDEIGHSQQGNNNAYSLDSEVTWLDWSGADDGLADFVARAIAARRQHPLLRAHHFLHAPQRAWFTPSGESMSEAQWNHPETRSVLMALSEPDAQAAALAVAINGADAPVTFSLPSTPDGWQLTLATCDLAWTAGEWSAPPRSLALFATVDATDE